MKFEDTKKIIDKISYKNWKLHLGQDKGGRMYLQVRFTGACAVTGKFEEQRCRKWWLSEHMEETELVQTALKAVLGAEEHEAKEHFKYEGVALFNPHISVRALMEMSNYIEVRKTQEFIPEGVKPADYLLNKEWHEQVGGR